MTVRLALVRASPRTGRVAKTDLLGRLSGHAEESMRMRVPSPVWRGRPNAEQRSGPIAALKTAQKIDIPVLVMSRFEIGAVSGRIVDSSWSLIVRIATLEAFYLLYPCTTF